MTQFEGDRGTIQSTVISLYFAILSKLIASNQSMMQDCDYQRRWYSIKLIITFNQLLQNTSPLHFSLRHSFQCPVQQLPPTIKHAPPSLPTLDPWSEPGPAVGVAAAVSCKMGKGGIHCQKTFGQSFSENNKTSNSVPPTHRDGWQRYFNSSLCQPFK